MGMSAVIPILQFGPVPDGDIPIFANHLANLPDDDILTPKPRRHDFYLILFLTGGKGYHFIDFQKYEVRPHSVYFIAPHQIQYWELEQPIAGQYLIFQESVFHTTGLPAFLSRLNIFSILNTQHALYLTETDGALMQRLLNDILSEQLGQRFGRREAMVSLLQYLLIWMQRLSDPAVDEPLKSAGERLTSQFMALVETEATREHQLGYYAEQLGVTLGHLTETVKAVMGHTAGALIRQRLVLEAERWLVHSELTMAEIAYKLNFNDPSYFGRFFKRETGRSPGTFRSNFRQKYQTPTS